ncbi:MAG: class D beta-lactamase [Shinella sp.]|nr:class D beta-lactamase [Shinella sp.]
MTIPRELKMGLSVLLTALGLGLQQPAYAASRIECTVILDAVTGETLHREGICDERFTPMSSFKLPLALIGYDAGILQDEHNPTWDYRPEFKGSKREQKTVDPTIWEKDSILWYSREITRRLGEERFADYVAKLGYGNADVSGRPGENGLTQSWLMSSLVISPDEQANFVRRFFIHALPLSDKAYDMTRAIIPVYAAKDGWTVRGKTGSGWLRDAAGEIDRNRPLGWFVGWAEKDEYQVVFARLEIGTEKSDEPASFAARARLIEALPEILKQQ